MAERKEFFSLLETVFLKKYHSKNLPLSLEELNVLLEHAKFLVKNLL
jgi:hypothetical protein